MGSIIKKILEKKGYKMTLSENKLIRKFGKLIKKFQEFCRYYGYDSKDEITLLWFFNRRGKAVKNGEKYFIVYQGRNYPVSLLINIFKDID